MFDRRRLLLAGLVGLPALAFPTVVRAADTPAGLAYGIVLRSRHAEAAPMRLKGAQTGGGAILVEQPEPNSVVVTMTGAAVAGSDCHPSQAALAFELEQDLEIVPARSGVRPPRVGLVARVVGTLQVSDPGTCGKACGAADEGPATASLMCGATSLLTLAVKPSGAGPGQELSVNHREGPVEAVAAPGCYKLAASFRLGASQGKGVFHRQWAVADFDPAPQLDAFWADALRPFRAVPRRDFGYKLVLRVVEDPAEAPLGR